jgi:hypothetical protein
MSGFSKNHRYSKKDSSKKYQCSVNEFSRNYQYSKNECSEKYQHNKNGFSNTRTVRTVLVRNSNTVAYGMKDKKNTKNGNEDGD